jgi:putative addiction module antidote
MQRIEQRRLGLKIGEALRQVDRPALGGEARHHGEDGRPHLREAGIDADRSLHGPVAVDGKKEVKIMRQASPASNRKKKCRSITSVITSTETTMFALKLTQIGNSVGIVLPKEALAMLHVDKGDTVYLVESPEGFSMTPYDPEVARQVEAGREFMREFRDTFHELAK